MSNANISESDWTIKGYHLARYNDIGDYSINNCRFIPYLDNINEKKLSESSIKASSENIKKYNTEMQKLKISDPEKFKEKFNTNNNINHFTGKRSEFNKDGKKRKKPESKRSDSYYIEFLDKIKNIDTKSWGWVIDAANLLNVSHTTINRNMKEIERRKLADMSNFYKRKNSIN